MTQTLGLKNLKTEWLFIDTGKIVGGVLTYFASLWSRTIGNKWECSVHTSNLI